MVAWDHVSREDVLAALRDYDRLGAEEFFFPARKRPEPDLWS